MKTLCGLAVAAVLAACSVPATVADPPTPTATTAVVATASATPAVSVLGTKLAKPRPTLTPKPKSSPKPAAGHTSRPKKKPGAKTSGTVCYVGRPCDLSHLTWSVSYGCTVAWRKATGKPCPPGWPPIP
jgi:hypothetical protein